MNNKKEFLYEFLEISNRHIDRDVKKEIFTEKMEENEKLINYRSWKPEIKIRERNKNKFNFKSPFSSNSIELDVYTSLKRKLQLGVQLNENNYNTFIKLKQKFENNDDLLIGISSYSLAVSKNNSASSLSSKHHLYAYGVK